MLCLPVAPQTNLGLAGCNLSQKQCRDDADHFCMQDTDDESEDSSDTEDDVGKGRGDPEDAMYVDSESDEDCAAESDGMCES